MAIFDAGGSDTGRPIGPGTALEAFSSGGCPRGVFGNPEVGAAPARCDFRPRVAGGLGRRLPRTTASKLAPKQVLNPLLAEGDLQDAVKTKVLYNDARAAFVG